MEKPNTAHVGCMAGCGFFVFVHFNVCNILYLYMFRLFGVLRGIDVLCLSFYKRSKVAFAVWFYLEPNFDSATRFPLSIQPHALYSHSVASHKFSLFLLYAFVYQFFYIEHIKLAATKIVSDLKSGCPTSTA